MEDKELMISQLFRKSDGKLCMYSELLDLYKTGELKDNGSFYKTRLREESDHFIITSYEELKNASLFAEELNERQMRILWNKENKSKTN